MRFKKGFRPRVGPEGVEKFRDGRFSDTKTLEGQMAPYGDNGKQPKETKVCTKTRQEEETDMI